MKLMIASDLHGSAHYCCLLLEAFRSSGADRLVLLGDLLYHGPRNPLPAEYDPPAVTAMLNEVKEQLLCVRGNCDADVDQMVLEFPILAEYCFLATDDITICATHGHTYGPENPPPLRKGDYLLCGHFHVPVCRNCGTYTYLNPGSVSLPKDGTPHSYMLVEDSTLTWYNLENGNAFQPRN